MTRPPVPHTLAGLDVPLFWPMIAGLQMAEKGLDLYARNLHFLAEEARIEASRRPDLASPNRVALDLRTMLLRDYAPVGAPAGTPAIVVAPYAGHTAAIADYHQGQSLIATLLAGDVARPLLTDWKSATLDMKDFEIDQYLAEINVAVDEYGGRAHFVGLCQGGWMSAMYAARFPHKVASLVLAGAPIDTDADDGPVKGMAHTLPTAFYEEMVALGGGLMRGETMLRGWKGLNPPEHYITRHIDLYEHIDDPLYLRKTETFERWYENPIDLPGRWYLQVIVQLFKENRLARGSFVGLGRPLDLKDITCPLYLLAGIADDITPRAQVFAAKEHAGTPRDKVVETLVPGGHIGLFMGSRALQEAWPRIARWIARIG